MNLYERLIARIQRLPIPIPELGIAPQLAFIQESVARGAPDYSLYQILNDGLSRLEQQLLQKPFLSPPFPLATGATTLGTTPEGNPVNVTIGDGDGTIQHSCICGSVHSGKTTYAGALACEAARTLDVLLIDSQNQFRRIPEIRESFEFVNLRDLFLQPDFESKEAMQVFWTGFAQSYSLQYGRMEAAECVNELREKGSANLPKLLTYMKNKIYKGFGNRRRYADSVCLTLSSCLDGLDPLFECETGMSLLDIITRGKLVLKMNCLVEHQAFFLRYLFDFCTLLKTSGRRLQRPLLIIIDEAQLLLEHGQADIADRMLTLRHSNVFITLCIQNPSTVPAKVINACSVFVVFNLIDYRDKLQISKAINCTKEQFEYLGTQKPREAVCFLPRSYSRPFILHLPHVQVDSSPIDIPNAAFIQDLEWTPLRQETKDASLLRPEAEALLRDVATKQYRFDSLSQRFLRLGIRSTSFQQALRKELITHGFVKAWVAIDVSGRKTLLEPLPKLYQHLDIQPPKHKGIGCGLLAQYYLERLQFLCSRLPDHTFTDEGLFNGKHVDGLLQLPDGRFRTHEVAVSLEHELFNAIAVVSAENLERHYILCSTKGQTKKLQSRIKKCEQLRAYQNRIVVLQVAAYAKTLESE